MKVFNNPIINIIGLIILFIIYIISIVFIFKKYKKYKKFFIIPIFFTFVFLSIIIFYTVKKNSNSNKKLINNYETTEDYELIITSKDLYNSSSYWIPKEKIINGTVYKPLGTVDSYNKQKPKKKSILVSEKNTSKPLDYQLIFKNDSQKLYVWKPISENNICLGDVITNTFEKPSTNLIRCVPQNWFKKNDKQSDVSTYNTENGSIWIGTFENSEYANLISGSNTSKNSLSSTYKFF